MSKIQFWKQFTTHCYRIYYCYGCYWYVKDTILKAIHNDTKRGKKNVRVVTDMSKIQFWKQFTTGCVHWYTKRSCYWYVKDTILKAIHNPMWCLHLAISVVTDMSKIQFWKQFTTGLFLLWLRLLLLLICQRYNFESNSQLKLSTYFNRKRI